MSGREELIRRIETGEGKNRELDAALCLMFNQQYPVRFVDDKCEAFFTYGNQKEARWHYAYDTHGFDCAIGFPEYTSSLDDAISLVEKMLPGMRWRIYSATPEANASAVLSLPKRGYVGRPHVGEHGDSACRALLIALLRALHKEPRP